jgi:RsiW-degrading membrane proteinase PrsW (M82 family)
MTFSKRENEVESNETEDGDAGRNALADPPSVSAEKRPIGLLGILLGATSVIAACLCGPLYLSNLVAGIGSQIPVQQMTGPFILAVGLGGILIWEGWQIWQGRAPRRFQPRRTWALWLAFTVLVASGILLSLIPQAPALPGVLINAVVLALLPVLVLATVGKLLKDTDGTWRDVTAGLISGASIGTGLAMVVEIALAVLAVVFLAAFGLIPGGLEGLESMIEQFNDPSFDILDPQTLSSLLSPGLIFLALAFVAIATPLIEEIVKTLGVGIAGRWLRPSPPRAFLMGVASGAGFALVENLLNGVVAGTFWIPSILSRLAATLMHCATGGLVGWGWGQLWSKRRLKRWLLAFIGAVGLHSLWNGTVGTMVATGLLGANAGDPIEMAASGLLILGLLVALIFLILASLGGLLWGSWALGRQRPQADTLPSEEHQDETETGPHEEEQSLE